MLKEERWNDRAELLTVSCAPECLPLHGPDRVLSYRHWNQPRTRSGWNNPDVSAITREQEQLLVFLVESERRALAEHGERDSFAWHRGGGMGPTELLHAGVPDGTTVDPLDMTTLIDAGFLQQSGQRSAYLTPDGIRRADELSRADAESAAIDLAWASVEPILKTLWREWLARGAPATGVPVEAVAEAADQDLGRVTRIMQLLDDGEWAEMCSPGFIGVQQAGPTYIPSASAVAALGGWPSPADAGARFLAVIDAAIDDATDEPTRGRLRGLRDAAERIGESVLGQLLAALAEGRIHL